MKTDGHFYGLTPSTIVTAMAQGIPAISPVAIEANSAQYRFDRIIQGHTITFPIEFVKEDGLWKILEF
jgi:hypothetical protein